MQAGLPPCTSRSFQQKLLKTDDVVRLALLQCGEKNIERRDDKDGFVVLGQASMAQALGDLWRQ